MHHLEGAGWDRLGYWEGSAGGARGERVHVEPDAERRGRDGKGHSKMCWEQWEASSHGYDSVEETGRGRARYQLKNFLPIKLVIVSFFNHNI